MFSCILPTRRMSNQIWAAADLKLQPVGMGASSEMTSTKVLIEHNTIIENQRAGANFRLLTGHKKDIVICQHLLQDHTRLAIYGWHQLNGTPIQQLNSTSHYIGYQDYSSSIRLILQTAILNGNQVNLYDILNSQYSYLISDEGAFNATTAYR